ncbi:MAG: phosphotransferase family protein [Rhodospirillales bacterium]|nr:phosphotransferase family protein [Rhodospirillales bacterium]
MDQRIKAAWDEIPYFAGKDIASHSFDRLGGLTNLVYRVTDGDEAIILRIPGEGTEDYIDRAVEAHNAHVAADAGVSAEVIYANPDNGIMLSRYLDGCETMTPETFPSTIGAPARAGEVLRQLHSSGMTFEFRFELFSMIDDYLGILDKLGAELPEGYHDVVREAEDVRAALDVQPTALAPCHCDPLCENFLDNGERMWVVDWEYSGMNDPMWDLGDLSVEAGFSDAHDREMMEAYCGGAPSDAEYGRMVIYKAMSDLLWTLWGLIQHANKNPVDDFWMYATNRFARCKTLMADPAFGRHVSAIRKG